MSTTKESCVSKPLRVLVILGTAPNDNNVGDRISEFVQNGLADTGHTVDVIDPLKLDLPALRQALHFCILPPKVLLNLNQRITEADAFLILTTEFNRQPPPALTNFLHHFPPKSYAGKASAIITYSTDKDGHVEGQANSGEVAASIARVLMVEFGAMPVPVVLSIDVTAEKQETIDSEKIREKVFHEKIDSEPVQSGFSKLVAQLDWWAVAARNQRQRAGEMPPSVGTREVLHIGKEIVIDTVRKHLSFCSSGLLYTAAGLLLLFTVILCGTCSAWAV